MKIRYATKSDFEYLSVRNNHISHEVLNYKIATNEILVGEDERGIIGFLRFSLFWDSIPFMNLLWIESDQRAKGIGRALTLKWEEFMKERKFTRVLTSSLSDEAAQHFYRKLGYKDVGSLLLPGEPLEIIFRKEL